MAGTWKHLLIKEANIDSELINISPCVDWEASLWNHLDSKIFYLNNLKPFFFSGRNREPYHLSFVWSTGKCVTSSASFSLTCSSRGYFSWGKGAIGQSNDGTSSLWIGLLCVVERQPRVRPWKAPSNERMERSGAPGACLFCNAEQHTN